jgi:hypothetical protein
MRAVLLFVFLASPVLAQGSAATTAALSACGPANIKLDVKQGQAQHPSEPESGQALVYVIEDIGRWQVECLGGGELRLPGSS